MNVTKVDINGRPDDITFKLENLFGDKDSENRINKLLSENWSILFDDIKEDYFQIANQLIFQLLQRFFKRVSIEEAFD